jgi:hypothetical protein
MPQKSERVKMKGHDYILMIDSYICHQKTKEHSYISLAESYIYYQR